MKVYRKLSNQVRNIITKEHRGLQNNVEEQAKTNTKRRSELANLECDTTSQTLILNDINAHWLVFRAHLLVHSTAYNVKYHRANENKHRGHIINRIHVLTNVNRVREILWAVGWKRGWRDGWTERRTVHATAIPNCQNRPTISKKYVNIKTTPSQIIISRQSMFVSVIIAKD